MMFESIQACHLLCFGHESAENSRTAKKRKKYELRRRIHLRQGYGATRGKSALSSAVINDRFTGERTRFWLS